MPSAEEIRNQQGLLLTYRRNLKQLLNQASQYGNIKLAPQITQNSITEARYNIGRIKDILRAWHVMLEDDPDDFEPEPIIAVKDVHVKISADKVMLIMPITDFARMLQMNPELLQFVVYKS